MSHAVYKSQVVMNAEKAYIVNTLNLSYLVEAVLNYASCPSSMRVYPIIFFAGVYNELIDRTIMFSLSLRSVVCRV